MLELGFSMTSEDCTPNELVRLAQRAEQAGFPFAIISDHYHPWTDAQGQSPFVWSSGCRNGSGHDAGKIFPWYGHRGKFE